MVVQVCLSLAALITSFWKSITWQAWKRPIEIPGIYKEYNPSQKFLDSLRRKPSPASPLSMLLQWCRLFFRFFSNLQNNIGRGYGGKGSHCPMLLSEIVWTSYAKYVASFYVMWISTPLQSHVRAPPVQRWRCTILNKIITAATAVKLHGNRCSLNHFDLNL